MSGKVNTIAAHNKLLHGKVNTTAAHSAKGT